MNVVPAQVLYNDLAACHAAARRRGPIGDESVVAIPGHHWRRLTCKNRSISFQLVARHSPAEKKLALPPVPIEKDYRNCNRRDTVAIFRHIL